MQYFSNLQRMFSKTDLLIKTPPLFQVQVLFSGLVGGRGRGVLCPASQRRGKTSNTLNLVAQAGGIGLKRRYPTMVTGGEEFGSSG